MFVMYEPGQSLDKMRLPEAGWAALEAAGWKIQKWWEALEDVAAPMGLSADAKAERRWDVATKDFPTIEDGVREWERVTGADATDDAGHFADPHGFLWIDDDGERDFRSGQDLHEWAGRHLGLGPVMKHCR